MNASIRPSNSKRACLAAGALFFAALIGATAPSYAAPHEGQIVGRAHIVDGDTLDVAGERVRLEGIDAPEITQTCGTASGGTWACGRAAAQSLRDRAGVGDVTCERRGRDKYGRVLGVCYAGGENLNEEMVKRGLAWAFVKYSNEFVATEQAARAARVGVWQGKSEAPWDVRSGAWETAEASAPNGCAIKGNISEGGRIYHAPWSAWYGKVRIDTSRGERWFCSEADALAAGWRPAGGP